MYEYITDLVFAVQEESGGLRNFDVSQSVALQFLRHLLNRLQEPVLADRQGVGTNSGGILRLFVNDTTCLVTRARSLRRTINRNPDSLSLPITYFVADSIFYSNVIRQFILK